MALKGIVKRRLATAVAAASAVTVLATGCSTTGGSTSASVQPTYAKNDLVLVASVINLTNPYMTSMVEGAKALSGKLGVPLKIVNANGSSQTEISQIQAILAEGKKVVLMVNTVASSDAPPIVNAVKAAGGYVTIWWNKPDNLEPWDVGPNFVAFQKHPGVDSGECTAKGLAESLHGKGNIIALPGVQDSTTSQTRVAGLEDALKSSPGVKILEERPANWDQQVAYNETQSLIAKYGDQINGVWAADDAMMLGAIQAFQQAGRFDQVKFASDGLYPPTIDLMTSHAGNDAVVAETFHRGYMAAATGLYTAYLAATGKVDVSKLPHEKRDSLFKISCVTPQNLADYTKYDQDVSGWIDSLIKDGPWNTPPIPLIGGGPEKLPQKG